MGIGIEEESGKNAFWSPAPERWIVQRIGKTRKPYSDDFDHADRLLERMTIKPIRKLWIEKRRRKIQIVIMDHIIQKKLEKGKHGENERGNTGRARIGIIPLPGTGLPGGSESRTEKASGLKFCFKSFV